jgi:Ca2+-binding EF-hand superfamily protein
VDQSGELNANEFTNVMKSIGFDYSDAQIHMIMTVYDADQSGFIQMEEFEDFLKDVLT